jgi:acyl-coenzyme A synthetase/AMP-(fatty) acid ligase
VVLKEVAKNRSSPPTPGSIQEWIKPRVAKHKWLTGGVEFVDEVPKSPSGKIIRKIMREWAKRDAEKLRGKQRAKL